MTRVAATSRVAATNREAATSRVARTNWRAQVGGVAYGRSALLERVTLLVAAGVRPRFDPTDNGRFVCDYPDFTSPSAPANPVYEVKLVDARTGVTLREVTKGSGSIPHHSNGNACFSPDGAFIIVQIQQAETPYAATGQWQPGYGFECDFWAYTIADGTWTQLTTHTPGGLGETVKSWVNGMFLRNGTQFVVTNRYADHALSGGHGLWQILLYDWAVNAGVPSLTLAAVPANGILFRANDVTNRPDAYYVTAMGHFAADHPSFANQLLVGGNLDGQDNVHMHHYAVNTTTGVVTGPVGNVRADAWEEDAAVCPAGTHKGTWVNVSNGESIYTLPLGGGVGDGVVTREFYLVSTDGATVTPLTGFNVAGEATNVAPGRGFTHIVSSGWSNDGRTLLGTFFYDIGGPTSRTVVQQSIIRMDFV